LLTGYKLTIEENRVFEELIGNFIWDRIKSITPSKAQTYDFTVPGTHSFLQNGILGSNTGGSFFITSTPKSDKDIFAKLWKGANNQVDEFGNKTTSGIGKNGYHPIRIRWNELPERNEKWASDMLEQVGEAKFRQEYGGEFVTDDDTLIDAMWLANSEGVEPEFWTNEGKVRWFAEPQPNIAYLVSLDPSAGVNRDDSCIQVVGFPDLGQIAEWQHNRSDPKAQVLMLMKILHFLYQTLDEHPEQQGDPEIFWSFENNSLGISIDSLISEIGEEKFPGQLVNERRVKGAARRRIRGMNMSSNNKRAACLKLKSLVESERLPIRSQNLLDQLKTFVSSGNSFKAKSGEKDDLPMACVVTMRMLSTLIAQGFETVEVMKEAISEEDLYGEQSGPMPIAF
jgi:hypothetical protein